MKDRDMPIFNLTYEEATLIRHQYDLDYAEAGPKAPVSSISYKGVRLESRFSVLAELNTMRELLGALPELMARRLASVWCDSRAGANYVINVRESYWAPELEWAIQDAIMKVSSGHNGIAIYEGRTSRADIEPNWDNEDY